MSKKDQEDDEVCEECGGSGFVSKMEAVYPNEPYMADIGEEPCPKCSYQRSDDDYNEEN